MSQALLFFAIHLLGVAVCLAVGPRRRPALCAALGFPVGLAVFVIVALALLAVRIPYRPGVLAGAVALVLAAAAAVAARRGIERRTLVVAALWTGGFAAVSALAAAVNVGILSFDSHQLVMLGGILADDGALAHETLLALHEWGVFQVVAQSMRMLTRQDFLYALPLVFGLSFVPVFALTLGQAARRHLALVPLVTAVLFTMSMTAYHLLYLHTNLASAVYLFGFVVLFWLAETERDPSPLPIAFLCLIAFALQRTEAPLFALLFLALALATTELPRPAVTPWLALFTVVVGLWYELLARHLPAEGAFLTPLRCRVVLGALLCAFVAWLAVPRLGGVARRIPLALAVLAALALGAAFATRPGHMLESTRHMLDNMVTLPLWGQSWFGLAALALIGLWFRPPRASRLFAVGVPVSLALVLLLAWVRTPYREGLGDSANRMLIHFVPLVFYYLAVKVIYQES